MSDKHHCALCGVGFDGTEHDTAYDGHECVAVRSSGLCVECTTKVGKLFRNGNLILKINN